MKPKLKIVCLGPATYVQLDGKCIGKGVEKVSFIHAGNEPPRLELTINLKTFSFMPDHYIDELEKKAEETHPPEGTDSGRTV